jgi:hypothetical protein
MSSVNTLVGNFSSINVANTDNFELLPNQLISIDTENNRLGVNTIDPSSAVHILYSTNSDISSGSLITQKLIINDISQTDISTNVRVKEVYVDSSGYLRIRMN